MRMPVRDVMAFGLMLLVLAMMYGWSQDVRQGVCTQGGLTYTETEISPGSGIYKPECLP